MKPLLLVYSETNHLNIAERIGMSEYSYYFVLKWFIPALEQIGEVKVIFDPSEEADQEFDKAKQENRTCILFSFAPPHRTTLPKRCPLIPLVAWEFERIPDHQWDENPYTDWTNLFIKTGQAITHSEFAKQAILKAMPEDYRVWSIPAPVWDRFSARGLALHGGNGRVPGKGMDIHITGAVLDSTDFMAKDSSSAQWMIPLSPQPEPTDQISADQPVGLVTKEEKKARRAARRKRSLQKFLARFASNKLQTQSAPDTNESGQTTTTQPPQTYHIQAKGIVYASILNSRDGRKNWGDLATAFVAAFQNCEDAVLVFKLNENDSTESLLNLKNDLKRFVWMKCRVIAFNGYLGDDEFQRFLDGIDYVVNASTGEGQCLPLMELMSMGTPAIAPNHTSMADYITTENAFILPSSQYLTGWPHDPRFIYSTKAFRVAWDCLRDTYYESYILARDNPKKYQSMSLAATHQLKLHNSLEIVRDSIKQVIAHTESKLKVN